MEYRFLKNLRTVADPDGLVRDRDASLPPMNAEYLFIAVDS
jgi:hypothetical protein